MAVDLSRGGFRSKSDEPLGAGEPVHIRVDRYGDFAALIRWVRLGEIGAEFLEPVEL